MSIGSVATAIDAVMAAAGYGDVDLFRDDADNIGKYFVMASGSMVKAQTGGYIPSYRVQVYFFTAVPESIHKDQKSFLRTFQFSTVPGIWESVNDAMTELGDVLMKESSYSFVSFVGANKKDKYIMGAVTMTIEEFC
jgi:hypothetical protein